MDEAIKYIINRIDGQTSHVVHYRDPRNGDATVILAPEGWKAAVSTSPYEPRFPSVKFLDVTSFGDYVNRFGDEHSRVFAGPAQILAIVDYNTPEYDAEHQRHRAHMNCEYSPDTAKQMAAIQSCLGRWLNIDTFEELIQKCGLVIGNATTLLESIGDLEGNEVVKVQRSRSGQSVAVAGQVKGSIDLPRTVVLGALYMGEPVKAELPLRAKVEANQIQFQIIDDGALDAATEKARTVVINALEKQLADTGIEISHAQIG